MNGNCLFSSMTLALTGGNSITDTLRLLTAVELYTNCQYYAKHPILISIYENNMHLFMSYDSVKLKFQKILVVHKMWTLSRVSPDISGL